MVDDRGDPDRSPESQSSATRWCIRPEASFQGAALTSRPAGVGTARSGCPARCGRHEMFARHQPASFAADANPLARPPDRRARHCWRIRRLMLVTAVIAVSGAVLGTSAPFGATVASASSTDPPALHVSGTTLTWSAISGVSSYVVASVRHPATTRDTTYTVVSGSSFAPAAVPGETVNYSVRTNVTGSNWAPEVAVPWPASVVPVVTVSGTALSWQAITGVSKYSVAIIRHPTTTRDTSHIVVTGTSFAPAAVPGETVNYSVKTNVAGSNWAPEVAIRWPTATPLGCFRG